MRLLRHNSASNLHEALARPSLPGERKHRRGAGCGSAVCEPLCDNKTLTLLRSGGCSAHRPAAMKRERHAETEDKSDAGTAAGRGKEDKSASKKAKQNDGFIHPHSRKAVQLRRSIAKDTQKTVLKQRSFDRHVRPLAAKLVWLQKEVLAPEPEATSFLMEQMQFFVESFISRNNAEIDLLSATIRRPTDRKPARLSFLCDQRSAETQSYREGVFEFPDLRDSSVARNIRLWRPETDPITSLIRFIKIPIRKELNETTAARTPASRPPATLQQE